MVNTTATEDQASVERSGSPQTPHPWATRAHTRKIRFPISLGKFFTVPGWSTHRLHACVTMGLYQGEQMLEPDEDIAVRTFPFVDVLRMIAQGDITDIKGSPTVSITLKQWILSGCSRERP